MKRRNEDENFENIKREKSNPVPMQGVGGDHPAWDIIIQKLDFKSQWKLSQQNQRLSEIVKNKNNSNKIQETLPVSKFFIWSHLKILDHYNFPTTILRSPIAILVRAEVLAKKFREEGLLNDYCGWLKWDKTNDWRSGQLANDDWEIKPGTAPAKD